MANLNFYQPSREKEVVKKNESAFSPSIFVGLALILLTLAVWGGLLYYNKQLDLQIVQVKDDISAAEKSLDRSIFSEVATFSAKISNIENVSLKRDNPSERIFNVIQANILKSGITATDISYEEAKREVGFSFEADNFELVAKQLMRFKSLSDYFSDVDFSGSERDQTGKLSCDFKLVIK